ncbi:hypothetical protein [Salinibacillus xinjiangensis]|uniref:Uncharacterized protein n=1 Tax=Salinibacillus xinjiangensis TaxID=1229268 RepID=A0A6G1XAZ0_9BACI|nr:hypothetical protein [Salinibacillus xinjiangensis]MRG88075.1 hypothetical protein [Salinibacillus xinjiangensis]
MRRRSGISNRHLIFNLSIILIPWLTMIFFGKRNLKRFTVAGVVTTVVEILNHMIGKKLGWWEFFDKDKSFVKNELPFDLGPYMPMSMWILRFTYGNFKKFLLLNTLADGLFTIPVMPLLKKMKIIRLHRLSYLQFFIYIFYKAFILYGVQYWVENRRNS